MLWTPDARAISLGFSYIPQGPSGDESSSVLFQKLHTVHIVHLAGEYANTGFTYTHAHIQRQRGRKRKSALNRLCIEHERVTSYVRMQYNRKPFILHTIGKSPSGFTVI